MRVRTRVRTLCLWGEGMHGLTLNELRRANCARQIALRDAGKDSALHWHESRFFEKLLAELGELACAAEDVRAGKPGAVRAAIDEMADVLICLDLLAMSWRVDLSSAVIQKFNARSAEMGIHVWLGEYAKSREVE